MKSLENVCEILNKVAKKADELLSNPKVGYPFQPFTPEATKAWKEMIKAVDKVNQGQPKKEQRVFQMLLIHVGFQLFSTDVNGECKFWANFGQILGQVLGQIVRQICPNLNFAI